MINLFRKNMAVQVLLIIVALVLLWLRPLMTPPPMAANPSTDGVLYTLLVNWLSGLPRLAVILAMILVLVEGVMLNILLSDAGLVPQTTLLPTFLYITLMSAGVDTLEPMVVVNGAMIGLVYLLMLRGTLLTIPTSRICSATALIGLSSMIYLPSLAMVVSYIFVAISFRLYNWRDIVALLLGLLAPYVLLVTVLYMSDGLTDWWATTADALGGFALRFEADGTLAMIANIALGLIVAASIFMLWSKLGEHPVLWQKNAYTVMLLTIGGIIMLFYSSLTPINHSFFALPFALCGMHLMLPKRNTGIIGRKKQRTWIYNSLLLITIIAAFLC